MSRGSRFKHSYYPRHDRYYYDRRHSYYNDWLLYELIRERDRYRDLYLDQLYEVDRCNPYYAEVTGCRL